MTKRTETVHQNTIAADPEQWSEQSKHSVAYRFMRYYIDEPYKCWRCSEACIFTALDQKYTFEIKKSSINRRRKFCAACWSESNRLRAALSEYDLRWAAEKSTLSIEKEFLTEWFYLLTRWKQFEPYKQDVAKINMVCRLLKLR